MNALIFGLYLLMRTKTCSQSSLEDITPDWSARAASLAVPKLGSKLRVDAAARGILAINGAAGAIGSMGFAVFFFVYVSFIDTELMQYIIENEPMGRFLNPYISSFIVALEGVFSGLLVTFILINYITTDEPTQGG